MTVPLQVRKIADKCRREITQDGDIPYSCRRELLLSFDKPESSSHPEEPRYRRTILALSCAEMTLDYWITVHPQDQRPQILLDYLRSAIDGNYDAELLEREMFSLQTVIDDVTEENLSHFRAMYAGWSCLAAVAALLYDSPPIEESRGEIKIDPDEWDASFYSCAAYCGGATWETVGDPQRRKEFWLWYLNEALDIAYANHA